MNLISYAQNFEDLRLWRAFNDVSDGRYLDVGTQGPVRDSVSLLFYERGWRGVHVEPTPAYAAQMREARPDETVIEAAVSASGTPLRLFEIPETGLSTGIPDIADKHKDAGWTCNEITVPTVTLASLFDFMGPEPIQWLKIDVEGMEADALKSWGDHPARPAALVIEATAPNTQIKTHEAWYDMVLSRGYTDVLFDGLSRYFIHEDHAERGEALALSPNVFDGVQIPAKHFAAGLLDAQHEAELARERAAAEAERAAERENLEGRLSEASEEVSQLRNEIEEQSSHHAQELEAVREQKALVETELGAAHEAIATLNEDIAAAASRHAEALARVAGDKAETERLLEEARTEVSRLAGVVDETRAEAEESNARLEAARARAADLEGELAKRERDHAEARNLALAELERTERQLGEATRQVAQLQARTIELARENGHLEGQLSSEREAHAEMLGDARAATRELKERLASTERSFASSRNETAQLRAELMVRTGHHQEDQANLAHAREELARAHDELEALRAEIAQMHAHNAWRENQLREASQLFASTTELIGHKPRWSDFIWRRDALMQHLASSSATAEAIARWQESALLPDQPADAQTITIPGTEQGASHHHFAGASETAVRDAMSEFEIHGPINNVPKLLSFQDRQFIRNAYISVLGRPPEPEGEAFYLSRLRAGEHKLAILKQLRRSPEGRLFVPGVAGLDRAIRRHVWATMPLIGALVRLFTGAEGNSARDRQLRLLANEVGRGRNDQTVLLSRLLDARSDTTERIAGLEARIDALQTASAGHTPADHAGDDHGDEAPAAAPQEATEPVREYDLHHLQDISDQVTPASIRMAIRAELAQ